MNISINSENAPVRHDAYGKIILLGEHAVVYGVPALAGGFKPALRAHIQLLKTPSQRVIIPQWQLDTTLTDHTRDTSLHQTMHVICNALDSATQGFELTIDAKIPHAAGLGASAGLAVVTVKALAHAMARQLTLAQINDIAFECEKIAHGTPSGLDNTLATFGGVMTYLRQAGGQATFQPVLFPVQNAQPIKLVVAQSGKKGFTAQTVARVRDARLGNKQRFDKLFQAIGDLTVQAQECISQGDYDLLSALMNENHGYLKEIGVSCTEIERVIAIGLKAGAHGAKLTGSGDGGSVIFYAGQQTPQVLHALSVQGIACFCVELSNVEHSVYNQPSII